MQRLYEYLLNDFMPGISRKGKQTPKSLVKISFLSILHVRAIPQYFTIHLLIILNITQPNRE